MKYDFCRTCSHLPSRWFTFTATWLLVFICGLSAGANTTSAQTRAYVTSICTNTVTVIDTATNTVIATIPVENSPKGVAITPDGTRAYVGGVTSLGVSVVTVIDTATNSVITNVPVGLFPQGVAITLDGTRVYVRNTGSNGTISVIDTATSTVIATLTSASCPFGIAFTPAPPVPTSKDECKNGGYRTFGPPAGPFRNQGQCVSYVESHSHH